MNTIFDFILHQPSNVEYQAGGGGGVRPLEVYQLTLEPRHSFLFYGSCRKRILIRNNSMPKRVMSQCGVSYVVFIDLHRPDYADHVFFCLLVLNGQVGSDGSFVSTGTCNLDRGTRLESRSGRIFVIVVVHIQCFKLFKGLEGTVLPIWYCAL